MSHTRRDFFKTTSLLSSGLLLTAASSKLIGCKTAAGNAAAPNKMFGIQLYTLRNELPKDPKGVIKQLAQFGYKQLEGFEGPQGMFWGMSNTEFKSYLDSLGLTMISSHCNINQDFERKADEAAAIGMKYLICPSYEGERTADKIDYFKKAADRFNSLGQICKQRGLRFAYHNHEATFKPVEGQMPQDVMMQGTDPSLVDYEMDMYWVTYAGQDPIAWFKKYPNRFRLAHIKDRRKDVPATERNGITVLGTGGVNIPEVLRVGRQNGLQYYIVEQDQTNEVPALTAVEQNAAYMKKLKL